MPVDAHAAADLSDRFNGCLHDQNLIPPGESPLPPKGFGEANPFSRARLSVVRNRKRRPRLLLRTVLSVVVGAGLGFGLYRVVGCKTGACPIWASPYASTIYGALLGFLMSR